MPGQLRNVIHAVSERHYMNRKDVQPVIEIFAEMARRCFLLQVAIGRRDGPHIRYACAVLPDALVAFLLEDSKKLALHLQRNFADFVQENGAALRCFKASRAVFDCAGEGASDVSEEFALEKIFRNGRAIDPDERFVFALAAVVDFSRDQLFAGARLTRNEHRSLRWRDQVNLVDDLAQGGALADELAEGLGLHHFLQQIGVMHLELRFEPLDFLEGARVGNGGTHVVTEELAPGTSLLAHFGAMIPNHNSQDLFLKTDRRAIESQNALTLDPNRIGQPFPVPIRLVQDDSASGRCDLAQKTCPHGYCIRRFAQSGRKAASGSSQTQGALCFINKPDLNARDLGGLLDAPSDDLIQQTLH